MHGPMQRRAAASNSQSYLSVPLQTRRIGQRDRRAGWVSRSLSFAGPMAPGESVKPCGRRGGIRGSGFWLWRLSRSGLAGELMAGEPMQSSAQLRFWTGGLESGWMCLSLFC